MPAGRSLKRFSVNRSIIYLGGLTTLFFILLWYANNIFTVRLIQVISDENGEKIVGVEKLKNKNIFLINEQTIVNQLIADNPFFKEVRIEKILPNRLNIFIKKQTPLAEIKADKGYLVVDKNSRIIFKKKDHSPPLPVINFYQSLYFHQLSAGNIVDYKEINFALKILEAIADLGVTVDTIDITGNDMIAFNLDEGKIILTTNKDQMLTVYQLNAILRQFRIEGRKFQILDLRFDKPVIKF